MNHIIIHSVFILTYLIVFTDVSFCTVWIMAFVLADIASDILNMLKNVKSARLKRLRNSWLLLQVPLVKKYTNRQTNKHVTLWLAVFYILVFSLKWVSSWVLFPWICNLRLTYTYFCAFNTELSQKIVSTKCKMKSKSINHTKNLRHAQAAPKLSAFGEIGWKVVLISL